MPDYGIQLETVYTPAFGGGALRGNGRWFTTEDGIVWTDDKEYLNLLDFDNYTASQGFIQLKESFKSSGKSAKEAFDAIADDEEADVKSGDLELAAQEYEEKMKPLTAAAPTEDDLKETASFGLTLDEDDATVLELVKSDESGVYVRSGEAWERLDPDADEDEYPTIYGAIWYDVKVDAIPVYDDGAESDLTKDDFTQFIIN